MRAVSAQKWSPLSVQRNGYRDETAYPQAAQGKLLPGFLVAAPDGREGADGRDPGGLCAGLDALGRRPGVGG